MAILLLATSARRPACPVNNIASGDLRVVVCNEGGLFLYQHLRVSKARMRHVECRDIALSIYIY
jgi:hypothetical protein